jgi:hypothetical protein
LDFKKIIEKNNQEVLTVEDFNLNSARGPMRKEIVKIKEKQKLNKSVDDDNTEFMNYSG